MEELTVANTTDCDDCVLGGPNQIAPFLPRTYVVRGTACCASAPDWPRSARANFFFFAGKACLPIWLPSLPATTCVATMVLREVATVREITSRVLVKPCLRCSCFAYAITLPTHWQFVCGLPQRLRLFFRSLRTMSRTVHPSDGSTCNGGCSNRASCRPCMVAFLSCPSLFASARAVVATRSFNLWDAGTGESDDGSGMRGGRPVCGLISEVNHSDSDSQGAHAPGVPLHVTPLPHASLLQWTSGTPAPCARKAPRHPASEAREIPLHVAHCCPPPNELHRDA